MTKRFYAVGMVKGWVQIRSAKKPPVPATTTATTTIKQRRLEWDPGAFNYVNRVTAKKMRLKLTVFEGGRTLWTIKASKLAGLLKVGVREGGIIELMPEQVEMIKSSMSGEE